MLATPRNADENGNSDAKLADADNDGDDEEDDCCLTENTTYTLLPIHAKSGLIAALLLFHRSVELVIFSHKQNVICFQ